MLVGVPKEIKDNEYRAGMVPSSVHELVHHGHEVLVQTGLGLGIGLSDDEYRKSGAKVIDSAEEIFARSELIVKVKEPQPIECKLLREGQVLFCIWPQILNRLSHYWNQVLRQSLMKLLQRQMVLCLY